MTCVICRTGQMKAGLVTVSLTREDCTVLIKGVPGHICDNCGEYTLTDDITRELLLRAESACRQGAEVEIIRFVA